jgi:alpha-D-glucose phosphate-specific phosphoglucomutase
VTKENPIKFGTDGWRGIIAGDFTFDNVRVCARAVAEYLKDDGLAEKGLVIGYDNRFASEDFAAAAAETVAACGIRVYLCPATAPTPVISYGTLHLKAGGAIIITASHNPAAWNGFKYKSESGSSAPDEVTAAIEKHVARFYSEPPPAQVPLSQALESGMIIYQDLKPSYFEQIRQLVNLDSLRNSGLNIVLDPMYGAGAGYLKDLLSGGTSTVREINGERNPLFPGIRPEPIAVNLEKLSATITTEKADIGIANDGDADRVGIIDENGRFLTTLQVFSLLTLYLLEIKGERGLIARTINTSVMIDRLAKEYGVEVVEKPVGFKHIAPLLLDKNAIIGGEESGGYGFRGHVAERDGVLAALYFLDLMVKTKKTPSQLIDYLYEKTGTHHYNRIDVHFPAADHGTILERVSKSSPREINGLAVERIDTIDGFRYVLADGSWLLIRFSGTEPLLRIYAESDTPQNVEKLLGAGKKFAGV